MIFRIRSVSGRIAVGKIMGLAVGSFAMAVLPLFGYAINSMLGWGTLLLFILMGSMIGLLGIFDRHPVFGFRLCWWIRGPLTGMAFALLLVLFTYDEIETIMQSSLLLWLPLQSPFWALIDGAFLGGLIGFVCTALSGEGEGLPLR